MGNSSNILASNSPNSQSWFANLGSRATNELNHYFNSSISIESLVLFLGMLRWTLRELVIFYKMHCQAWFYKKPVLVGGRDGCSGKELSARQKVLAEVFSLILSASQ